MCGGSGGGVSSLSSSRMDTDPMDGGDHDGIDENVGVALVRQGVVKRSKDANQVKLNNQNITGGR